MFMVEPVEVELPKLVIGEIPDFGTQAQPGDDVVGGWGAVAKATAGIQQICNQVSCSLERAVFRLFKNIYVFVLIFIHRIVFATWQQKKVRVT